MVRAPWSLRCGMVKWRENCGMFYITRHGVPTGILIGFEDPETWWEELLLRDPRFRARVAQARSSLRDGQGISIEKLCEKYNIKSQAAKADE